MVNQIKPEALLSSNTLSISLSMVSSSRRLLAVSAYWSASLLLLRGTQKVLPVSRHHQRVDQSIDACFANQRCSQLCIDIPP